MNGHEMTDAEISAFYHSGLDWVNSYIGMLEEDALQHYGTKEHSGRYEWGSGLKPFQRLGGLAKAGFQRLAGKKKDPNASPSNSSKGGESNGNASSEKKDTANSSSSSKGNSSNNTITEEEATDYYKKNKHLFFFDRDKKPQDMSDEELDNTIRELETQLSRLNKEKKVSDLRSAIKNYGKPAATPNQKKDGNILKKGALALVKVNGDILKAHGKNVLNYAYGSLINQLLGANATNPGARVPEGNNSGNQQQKKKK